jgi:hypothetical protein
MVAMTTCSIHTEFFDDCCPQCKIEYRELKGNVIDASKKQDTEPIERSKTYRDINRISNYKEFNEERAKKLYGELFIQYVKKSFTEEEAAEKAKAIVRKQCRLRGFQFWAWTN